MIVRHKKDRYSSSRAVLDKSTQWPSARGLLTSLALLLAMVLCGPVGCGWGLTFLSYDVKDQAPQPPETQVEEPVEDSLDDSVTTELPTGEETRPGNPEAWGPGAQMSVGRSFDPIYFDPGSSELDYSARNRLKDYADWLKAHPSVWVTLAGYAADDGTGEFALNLSMARTLAVEDFLVGQGLTPVRLFTISYGDLSSDSIQEPSQPSTPEEATVLTPGPTPTETKTAQARVSELERRVEILAFIAPIGVSGPESVLAVPGEAPDTQQPASPQEPVEIP